MKLAKAGNSQWALPLAALTSGLRHMGLSQFAMRELLVLEGELQKWHATAPLVRAGADSPNRCSYRPQWGTSGEPGG